MSDDRKTALYRWFDSDGGLLYVGISECLDIRLGQHEKEKPWLPRATRITVEWFEERKVAEAAEKVAIATEIPIFNIRGTGAEKADHCWAIGLDGSTRIDGWYFERKAAAEVLWWARGAFPEYAERFQFIRVRREGIRNLWEENVLRYHDLPRGGVTTPP